MQKDSALFSSDSDDWETPQELYDLLNVEFLFAADMAASKENYKYHLFFSKEDDALCYEWEDFNGFLWCNPPYSKIKKFAEHAYRSYKLGAQVVMLIPARTDTKYWHDYISKATEIRFLKGRLKFSNSKNSAPFPSAIVIFDSRYSHRECEVSFWDWRKKLNLIKE